MDEIRPNREEFENEAPLFTEMNPAEVSASVLSEQPLPDNLDQAKPAGEELKSEKPQNPSEGSLKEEGTEAGQQDGVKKRHRSTKAEMAAKRMAAAGQNPVEEKGGEQPVKGEPDTDGLRHLPIVEAVFRMGLELSCPKTNDQVDADGKHWAYRNVEDILCALKPLMKKYGVFVTFASRIECVGELNYVVVEATARNLSGETFTTTSSAREDFVRPGNWAAQITGSCESYAKKYALQSMFMIDNTKLEAVQDPDATSNKAPLQPAASREQAAQPVREEKAGLREALKPLLVRGCGDWMTRAADAANWNGTREEYALKVRRNYRISEDDLLILLSAIPVNGNK